MDGEKTRMEEGGRREERKREERRKGQSHFAEPAGLQCTVKLNKSRRKGGGKRAWKKSVKLHSNTKYKS